MLSYVPRRMLVVFALAFGAGIFMGVRLTAYGIWLAAGILALIVAVLLSKSGRKAWLVAASCFFFCGAALCSYTAHPALPPEGRYHVRATVREEAEAREEDGRVKTLLKDAVLTDENGTVYHLDGLYWTYWPEIPDETLPQTGQTVEFTAKLYHPQGKTNPYGFDFKLYLLQNNVQAGVSGAEELTLYSAEHTGAGDIILRIRRAILTRLEELLGDGAYLAQALLLGEKEGMPEKLRAGFRKAGVAHVLSVSGLHAVMIMSVVMSLLDRLDPSPPVMLGVVSSLLAFYCELTGGSAPMIRAAILVAYQLGARCVRRTPDPLTALAIGFLGILTFRPLELFSAGFQMSFGAVLGMIMLGDRLNVWLQRIRHAKLRRIGQAFSVTLSATLGTVLPVIYTYNSLSLIGLFINPLVCMLLGVLLPATIVLLLVSLISMPLAMQAGRLIAFVSNWVAEGVRVLGDLPFATVNVPDPPWYLAVAIVLCLILCTRYVDLQWKKRCLLGGAALLCSCAAMIFTANPHVRYVQLDVGNADAAVIADGRKTIVIDAGEYGGDLSSYLLSTGRRADMLILTHLHTDHALGLGQLLADEVAIGAVYISTEATVPQVSEQVLALLEQATAQGIPVYRLCSGAVLQTERVQLEILWPYENTAHAVADANDSALALRIDLNGVDLLHMSDLSGTYALYAAQPAEILKVSHHGSAVNTNDAFLARVQPTIALISGDDPHEKTLERLANAGAMVYDTGTYGALTITVCEDTYTMESFLR